MSMTCIIDAIEKVGANCHLKFELTQLGMYLREPNGVSKVSTPSREISVVRDPIMHVIVIVTIMVPEVWR